MVDYKVNIAGIKIKIRSEKPLRDAELLEVFSTDVDFIPDLYVSARPLKRGEVFEPTMPQVCAEPHFKWGADSRGFELCIYDMNNPILISRTTFNHDFSIADIVYRVPEEAPEDMLISPVVRPIGEVFFRNRLMFMNGIVIHASAINYKGGGIVFTAPSETGKTTQSHLWRDFLGAHVINGDRPAMRYIDGELKVCGTPWCGTSREYTDERIHLRAIVVLAQAPFNRVTKLSGNEAMLGVLPRMFLPYYDWGLMETAMRTVEKIMTDAPIYMLECTPDRAAVVALCEKLGVNFN